MAEQLQPDCSAWPNGLKDLHKQEPKGLWYEGDISLLTGKCVCIVGSRRLTDYGRRVIEKMTAILVEEGNPIISGFMYGTDQAVHREVIKCGGKTAAVLGWGIKQKLEDSDLKLANEIIATGGIILSEWDYQLGALWTFPRRDRIMAALASDIYVVEAAMRSGSLITAEWGTKLQRRIWAVPGPVTSKVSEGTNWLIDQGLAKVWTGTKDRVVISKVEESNKELADLYSVLENEQLSADEIARKLNKPVAEIGAQLSLLELEGKVSERGGKYYWE